MSSSRLSKTQWKKLEQRARQFRQTVEQEGSTQGFSEVFRLAALKIEADVDAFFDHAQIVFEEIEAYGQEPVLDGEWLGELTGEKDSFYFSTDALVTELEKLPLGSRARRKSVRPDENAVAQAVEDAVQNLEDAIAVSHSENVNDWINRIAIALEEGACRKVEKGVSGKEKDVGFWWLQACTGLSPSALWLGLLLGHHHWTIRQTHFYGELSVRLRESG